MPATPPQSQESLLLDQIESGLSSIGEPPDDSTQRYERRQWLDEEDFARARDYYRAKRALGIPVESPDIIRSIREEEGRDWRTGKPKEK